MSGAGAQLKRVLFEALFVGTGALVLAIIANAASPRGLALTRNYFPVARAGSSVAAPVPTNRPAEPVASRAQPDSPAERLKSEGLKTIDGAEAARLFADPRFQQELIVFIDARADEHFLAGHIPGAIEFDRFHPERCLADVLTACRTAEQVVVYCHGGECEDSEYAALTLRDAGVPNEKLSVYLGGIEDWSIAGRAVEIGARLSGNLRQEK